MASSNLDIVFSFDTTGSMSSCLGQVRNKIVDIVNNLFTTIPNLNIAIINHGDYCDGVNLYRFTNLSSNKDQIINFVQTTSSTSGGDLPEAYEYVLRESKSLAWRDGSTRILVMIGDALPHESNDNPYKIDWREQCHVLKTMGIAIYSIQCLDRGNNQERAFYSEMATITGGIKLYLDQFSFIIEVINAICYRQLGNSHLENYQEQVQVNNGGALTTNMRQMFDIMLGRRTTEEVEAENDARYDYGDSHGSTTAAPTRRVRTATSSIDFTTMDEAAFVMRPCAPSRFQVMDVASDCDIKGFVTSNGITFAKGRGFYQLTKPEVISKKKEIILQKKNTGELFEGLSSRRMLNLIDYDEKKKFKCTDYPEEYLVFIQSTSVNRKLLSDTKFLYEVDGF
jgi:hypothetical protein